MKTLMIMSTLTALIVGLAQMPALNIFKVCAWNAGTERLDPWRVRSNGALRSAAASIRSWLLGLFTPRLAFASLAVLLAILAAHHGQAHDAHGVLGMAVAPTLVELKAKRTTLVAEADAFRGADGQFKDDAARASFDAKMTEVDGVDAQIRQIETAAASTQDAVAIATAERNRVTGIQDAVRAANKMLEKPIEATFETGLISRGVSLAEAQTEIFKEMAKRSNDKPTNGQVTFGEAEQDKFMRGATNWLLVKSGALPMVAKHLKVEPTSIDPGEFRGLSLVELARLTVERAGQSVRGLSKLEVVSKAFTLRGNTTQSTSDFATLLENVMNKVLLAAYAITPDTWRQFCATGTVSDFRAQGRYRMGTFGPLDSLSQNGEFKEKVITDAEKNSITAATKGNIINVSRQMIVNDDMGAFSRLITMLGRAAALSIEVDVFALLAQNSGLGPTMADTHPLFDAAHSNISTGAALSAAAIDLDRVQMANQKDKDGNEYLGLRPSILVVPVALGGQAKVINQSQYDPDNLTSGSKATYRPNVVAGLFASVVDTPRISGTRRYLFADPGIAPTIEVAFLDGQTDPVIESQDGWRTDGAEMKVRFDYAVGAVDFRTAVTNAGA